MLHALLKLKGSRSTSLTLEELHGKYREAATKLREECVQATQRISEEFARPRWPPFAKLVNRLAQIMRRKCRRDLLNHISNVKFYYNFKT